MSNMTMFYSDTDIDLLGCKANYIAEFEWDDMQDEWTPIIDKVYLAIRQTPTSKILFNDPDSFTWKKVDITDMLCDEQIAELAQEIIQQYEYQEAERVADMEIENYEWDRYCRGLSGRYDNGPMHYCGQPI